MTASSNHTLEDARLDGGAAKGFSSDGSGSDMNIIIHNFIRQHATALGVAMPQGMGQVGS